jgi:predicted transcriptional regulator
MGDVRTMDDEMKKRLLQGLSEAETRQRLLDIAAYESAEEGIRQGLDDLANGRTIPAKEAFDRIRRKYNIPR